MSMTPFFPLITPPIANRIWFDYNVPVFDEAEILRYEREHQHQMEDMKTAAADIIPLGKDLSGAGQETDDEDANDDSDDSDNSDDDDTNERVVAGQQERSVLGSYSPEEVDANDDMRVPPGGSQ